MVEVKGDLSMRMEMSMKANGWMTRRKPSVSWFVLESGRGRKPGGFYLKDSEKGVGDLMFC